MATHSLAILTAGQMSISGGETLGGSQNGAHLLGESITFQNTNVTVLNLKDGGSDPNFDDDDKNQMLDGDQTFDGVTYSNSTKMHAEYQLTLTDPNTGITYQIVGISLNTSGQKEGAVMAFAFVGQVPPAGVALTVTSTADGPSSGDGTEISYSSFVTCFLEGTMIQTPKGPVEISTLRPGDKVLDGDGRPIVIRWMGRRRIREDQLEENDKLRPVRIVAGALGDGLPKRDLVVSRQHRMLVRSRIAQRMFGQDEVLIPAVKLTELPGIFIDTDITKVVYFHLLFDKHEIIVAEGAPTESLYTGPEALKSMSEEAREEILTLFPEVAELDYTPTPARYIPAGKQQKRLIERHQKNRKPLLM